MKNKLSPPVAEQIGVGSKGNKINSQSGRSPLKTLRLFVTAEDAQRSEAQNRRPKILLLTYVEG